MPSKPTPEPARTAPELEPGVRTSAGRRWRTLFLVFLGCHFLFFALQLVYPDLTFSYPFPGNDGWDWVSNGLAMGGEDVRSTGRPPVLPLLLALLDRLTLLHLFPVVNQLVAHLGILALFLVLERWYPPEVAVGASVVLLVNHDFLLFGLAIGADHLASLLLFLAVVVFLRARSHPRRYLSAALIAALSALTQQTALLLPVVVGLTILRHRRSHLRSPWLWGGATLFVMLSGSWFLWKRLRLGVFGDVIHRQWGYVGVDPSSLDYYLVGAVGLLGIPAAVLAFLGIVRMVKAAASGDERSFAVLVLLATLGIFFGILYVEASRLLLYGYFFVGIPLAEGLSQVRRRGPALLAASVAVAAAWSVTPVPVAVAASPLLLWPAPHLYLDVPVTSDGEWSIDGWPRGEAWSRTAYARVWSAWREREAPPKTLPPQLVADCHSIVALEGPNPLPWYATMSQLGNTLRKRVKRAPRSAYPPDWWGWQRRELLGVVGEFVVVRVEIAGLEQPRLLALDRREPRWRLWARPIRPQLPPPELDEALEVTRRLDELAGPHHRLLVAIAETPQVGWFQILPFHLRSTHFFLYYGPRGAALVPTVRKKPAELVENLNGVEIRVVRPRETFAVQTDEDDTLRSPAPRGSE